MNTVDFIIWTIGEVGGIKLMFTLGAEEAFLVVRTTFGNLLLSLKDTTMTSGCKKLKFKKLSVREGKREREKKSYLLIKFKTKNSY